MKNIDLENINKDVNKSQIELAYNMTKSIDDDFIEYVYRGHFSEDITLNILNLTEAKFVNDKDAHKKQKRISYLLIESLQNVIRHGDKPKDNKLSCESLLVIHKTENSIFITTGNIIENKNITKLNNYLTSIKESTKEELDKKYNKTLLDGIITKKGGGGLGLLTMIRRTNGRFKFSFKKLNEEYSYYYYQIQIVINEDNLKKDNHTDLTSLKRISKFHELLNKENVLLNFNGSFAFKNLENILPFIESHSIGGKEIKQRVFDLTVKTIKNIVKYADNFPGEFASKKNGRGVFLLSNKNGKIFLTAGNLIVNDKTILLSNKINIINETDAKSLVKIRDYLEKFYSYTENTQPDLSLINIKLRNKSNINYTFKRINSQISYFILQLVI